MKIHDEGRSPVDLFMVLNESEIARYKSMDLARSDLHRQLTLIEFKMFCKIKPSELLNQSWNKVDLQHRSPNILAMISRANKLSFWVANLIVWFERLKDRSKILSKILKIAEVKVLLTFNVYVF
jgi:son of sevenless-like protein